MNHYIKTQLNNIKSMVEALEQSCEIATIQDDKTISHEEIKIMRRIKKANCHYLKELSRIETE